MRFNVGDIVRISKKFTCLEGEEEYPSNTNGIIMKFADNYSDYPIKVKFDDVTYTGSYAEDLSEFKEEELRLVRRPS